MKRAESRVGTPAGPRRGTPLRATSFGSAAAECRRQEAEQRTAAAEQYRRDAELQAQERAREWEAEIQRLTGFFEQTGLDATVWQVFTQMVRSASGKAIQYGDLSPAHGNGLLVLARPRWESGRFNLAGVGCPDLGAPSEWPKDLTIPVRHQTWLSRLQAAARAR